MSNEHPQKKDIKRTIAIVVIVLLFVSHGDEGCSGGGEGEGEDGEGGDATSWQPSTQTVNTPDRLLK